MTYIRSIPRYADTDETVTIHLENAKQWLEDAKTQAYKNPASLAFALEQIIDAVETLASDYHATRQP